MTDILNHREPSEAGRCPYLRTGKRFERWEYLILTTLTYPLFLLAVLMSRLMPGKQTSGHEIPGRPALAEAWDNASSAIAFAFNAYG